MAYGRATPLNVGTTGGGRTVTEEWRPPRGRMPKYSISEAALKSMTQREAAPAMRTTRRGLQDALREAQTAGSGPMRAYLMERALGAFSGGIGTTLQGARRYAQGVLGEKARLNFQAAIQSWLKQGTQTTTGPGSGTSTQPTPRITATPQIRRPGPLARLPYTATGWRPGPGGSRYAQPAFAKGGPVTKGGPYIVGEEGPEIFMPKQGGTIIPNPKTQERMGKTHQFDFRQFLSRQYGGDVAAGGSFGMAGRPTASPTEEMAPPTEILPTGGAPSPGATREVPTVAPPTETPSGVRAPGFADLYRDLLKRKRKQTSLRTLI